MKYKLVNENFTEDYTRELLRARGVEDIEEFMHPTTRCLQSPTALKNIAVGAAVFLRVVKNGGRVLLIVDSDCDGYSSGAIIYQYMKRLNPNCHIDYWLHEGKEHGLQDHINHIEETNIKYDLVVTPDSSSNDFEYHERLEKLGVPCLVLDHHLQDLAASANALIINNQTSPDYHNKELVGAGVVYQFCRYLDIITGNDWADDYLDLVALAQIGDMGSVLEMENRYLICRGLSEKHLKNDFLKCLLNKQAYSITGKTGVSWQDLVSKITPTSVAFYIVPLINAMIRVGTKEEKERLFTAFIDGARLVPSGKRGEKGVMTRVDVESARECTNAKAKQDKIKKNAVEQLEAKIFKHDLLENKVLFVRLEEDDKFPSELTGLIAMSLSAQYKKPTIVARLNELGFDRGSARGLNQSELRDFRQFLLDSGLFEYALGHSQAFGLSIADRDLSAFHAYANEALKNIDFGENVYDVNFVRGADSKDLHDLVCDLAEHNDLWGQKCPEAMICVTNIITSPRDVRIMGSNQDTLKIEYNGISYLKFRATDMINELKKYDQNSLLKLTVVGRANMNEWMGRKSPQIFIDDYEFQALEPKENKWTEIAF